MKINENDRLAVAIAKRQEFEGSRLLFVFQVIECDSNSLLAGISILLSTVHLSIEDLDLDILRDITERTERGTIPRQECGHIDLFEHGKECLLVLGYYDSVTKMTADYSETQYFNVYELKSD